MLTVSSTDPTTVILAADHVLGEVTRTIVEHLQPRRIVLFGSRARGDARDESDYDIMVEMDTELGSGAVLDLFPRRAWSMDVLVYTADELQRRKDDVGFVVYDVVREGRVLYCRPDVVDDTFRPAVGSAASRVREGANDPPESLASWIARAQEDYDVMEAASGLVPPTLGPVCFHAHQCAEKLLKACLIANSIRPPRTHDLRALLDACIASGLDLETLRPACDTLYELWPKSRYPSHARPTQSDAQAAARAAAAIRSAVVALIQHA